jgi:hypothetical protein
VRPKGYARQRDDYDPAPAGPRVSCVLTGTANAEHLADNARALLGGPLPEADRRRISALFGPIRRNLGN